MKKLTLIDKAFLLKRTSLFRDLDLDLLLAIADKLTTIKFNRGKEIFPIRTKGSQMYIIAKGSVCLQNGEDNTIATLYPADFFGDESLFNEDPRKYSAKSHTDCTLLTLSKTHIHTIISECPTVALGFLERYTKGGEKR